MIDVAVAEQPPSPGGRFDENSISAWIWRPVSNTVLDHVNVNTGSQRIGQFLPMRTLHDLLYTEIGLFRVFLL
jgi:hypothetical protein